MTRPRPPSVHYLNWPDAKSGPWLIGLHLALVAGRLECVGVEILSYERDFHQRRAFLPQSDKPGDMDRAEPVRATTIRKIPLGKLLKETVDSKIALGPRIIEAVRLAGLSGHNEEESLAAAQASRAGRGGRRAHPAEHYAEVAEVYRGAFAKREHPTKAVADCMEWQHVDAGPVAKSTAAKWVATARKLGFLGQTTQGRPGASVTGQGSVQEVGDAVTAFGTVGPTQDENNEEKQG